MRIMFCFFIILMYSSVIYSHRLLTGIYLVHGIMSSPVLKELVVYLEKGENIHKYTNTQLKHNKVIIIIAISIE